MLVPTAFAMFALTAFVMLNKVKHLNTFTLYIIMNRIEPVPSGIRLQQLIQNHHAEIVESEMNNDRFIHLYAIGTYWVAFERSAFRLNALFRQCETTLFRVPGYPDYVVMASVSVDEAEAYFHKRLISDDKYHHKVLFDNSLPVTDYYKWHEAAVKSVL